MEIFRRFIPKIKRFKRSYNNRIDISNKKKHIPWVTIIGFCYCYWIVKKVVDESEKKNERKKVSEMRKNLNVDELEVTELVFLDVFKNDKELGEIVIGLFGKDLPKTVQNFVELSKKEKEGYKGTKFHRVVKDFMIQGGDNEHKNGYGGISIYGRDFDDENLVIPTFIGCVAMANKGKNTNASQFFITTQPTPWLDGQNVVFGRVLKGFNVVQQIEDSEVEDQVNFVPKEEIIVKNSGVFEIK